MLKNRSLPYVLLTLLLASALIVTGCGSSDKNESSSNTSATDTASTPTPEEEVAKALETAINLQVDGEVAEACATLTDAYAKKQFGSDCEAGMKETTAGLSDYLDRSTIKATNVKVDGDKATATMTFSIDNPETKKKMTMRTVFSLQKVDGEWKLSADDGGTEVNE